MVGPDDRGHARWGPSKARLYRSLIANPGTQFYLDPEQVVVRDLEAPSGGSVASARAWATAYGVLAMGGRELGLCPETFEALKAEAIPSLHGFYDECFSGACALLARLHEAERIISFRASGRLWRAWRWRCHGLRGPAAAPRLWLRHELHGQALAG